MERRSWGRRARRTGQARPSMYFSLVFFPWSALSTLFFSVRRCGKEEKGSPQYNPVWLGTGNGHVIGV